MGMAALDSMYQFSLNWFINIYQESFDKSDNDKSQTKRIENIIQFLTSSIHSNVTRALFEKDKILFTLLLTFRIMEIQKSIIPAELNYLIHNDSIQKQLEKDLLNTPNPNTALFTYQAWLNISYLATLSKLFQSIKQSLIDLTLEWHSVFNSQDPFLSNYPETLTSIQKLCLIKAIKPEKLLHSLHHFIAKELGE